ncbi:MAG TPA: hypothetical protein VFX20_17940 [Steroidobacteraceae bacterium]|nr:hypothetical protein [Steroidobacteraceae bacterium]
MAAKKHTHRRRCSHRNLVVRTEGDRCSWVQCADCRKVGPAKHSYMLALICFATATVNQHPRRKRSRR